MYLHPRKDTITIFPAVRLDVYRNVYIKDTIYLPQEVVWIIIIFLRQVGDQILEVNGQSFLDVTHDEAVSQLKYHKRMSLLVRDVGKVPHSCTAYDRDVPWDQLGSPGYAYTHTY